MTEDEILQGLYDQTLVGNGPAVLDLTNTALAQGMEPQSLLFDALIPSLEEVGARFERGDFFVPQGKYAQLDEHASARSARVRRAGRGSIVVLSMSRHHHVLAPSR